MDVKAIGVIGAGVAGRGIAYAAALAGYRTVLEDISPHRLDEGVSFIRRTFEEEMARGRVTAERKEKALANLSTVGSVEGACRLADMLIETVAEEMEIKLEIFTIFDKFAKPDAILATTTSSLSIAEIAAITFRTENCIGMRFFHPVPKLERLEVVRALESSDTTVAACVEVGRRMGAEVAVVREASGVSSAAGSTQ
ncbi:MAG: 3-hydroxyacyl-CoA dehydrogenase family protein [Candidatus Acidiferrales bacterium]